MPDFTNLESIVDRLTAKRERARKLSIIFHTISWPGLIVLACFFGAH